MNQIRMYIIADPQTLKQQGCMSTAKEEKGDNVKARTYTIHAMHDDRGCAACSASRSCQTSTSMQWRPLNWLPP
jgi:hypothetical protein